MVSATNSTKKGNKCTALAMSGGGAKGAYEAGALYGFVKNDPHPSKYAYDVVTGVSVGAINSFAVGVWRIGTEEKMVEWLSHLWASITSETIYKDWWPLGLVTGITSKTGVYDFAPGTEFLTEVFKEFNNEIKRKMAVSCVDVVTGNYVVFYENSTNVVEAVVSSAAMPFVFPNVKWPGGVVCMDGGTVWNTNLPSAVDRCLEIVDDPSQITLDIMVLDTNEIAETVDDPNNALTNFLRFKTIKDYHTAVADVYEFK